MTKRARLAPARFSGHYFSSEDRGRYIRHIGEVIHQPVQP